MIIMVERAGGREGERGGNGTGKEDHKGRRGERGGGCLGTGRSQGKNRGRERDKESERERKRGRERERQRGGAKEMAKEEHPCATKRPSVQHTHTHTHAVPAGDRRGLQGAFLLDAVLSGGFWKNS